MSRRISACGIALVLAVPALPVHAAVHRMFVTSASGPGDLSQWPLGAGAWGIAAGDQICQKLADRANLPNPANFVAWLSDEETDAFCHVAGLGGHVFADCNQATLPNAGPWQRTDGKPFSNRLAKLTGQNVTLYPAVLDETGAEIAPGTGYVHTATRADGTVFATTPSPGIAVDCWSWTSSSAGFSELVGYSSAGTVEWTQGVVQDCSSSARLLCFEKGSGERLPSFAKPGAFAFVSSETGSGNLASWPNAQGSGKTGIAAGDAICRGLAAQAGYANPGSFLALLSVDGAPAAERLTIDGPWRRPGGVEIAAAKAALFSGGVPADRELEADVQVDEKGIHADGLVFTGTGIDGQPTGKDCAGWTSGASSDQATQGDRVLSDGTWTDNQVDGGCDIPRSLYCFSNVVSFVEDGFESGDTSAWDETSR